MKEQLRDSCATARDKAMVEFLYSTGCRVTEIVNINKSDVNCQLLLTKVRRFLLLIFY